MFDLESLGISKEELQERVVDAVANRLLETVGMDEDGEDIAISSPMAKRLEKSIRELIDDRVASIAQAHVLPRVNDMVDNLMLQKTNQWGEKVGNALTFTEYMTNRAEGYLTEKVSSDGKSKDESGNYSWNGTQTRVTYLVNKHLQYEIQKVIDGVMKNGLTTIAQAVHETVRLQLNDCAQKLKVTYPSK